MKIGVLALQGDVREHIACLNDCGVDAAPVRRKEEISSIDGLIIPGGESTTISKLARTFEVFESITRAIAQGLPVYGSCAGMILLADRVEGAILGQETFGGLDITVRRNAFGRQVESFEADLALKGITAAPFRAIFIRAPWVENHGSEVEVLGSWQGHPVAVRAKNILATAFHPELTGDNRVHRYFIEEVCSSVISR